jgi:hypothetical protein
MDILRTWLDMNSSKTIVPVREQPSVGVQPPGLVDIDTPFTPETAESPRKRPNIPTDRDGAKYAQTTLKIPEDPRAIAKAREQSAKGWLRTNLQDVSGDACSPLDHPPLDLKDFVKKHSTACSAAYADDVCTEGKDKLKRALKCKMFKKERKEHPTLPDKAVDQIVKDHYKEGVADAKPTNRNLGDLRTAPKLVVMDTSSLASGSLASGAVALPEYYATRGGRNTGYTKEGNATKPSIATADGGMQTTFPSAKALNEGRAEVPVRMATYLEPKPVAPPQQQQQQQSGGPSGPGMDLAPLAAGIGGFGKSLLGKAGSPAAGAITFLGLTRAPNNPTMEKDMGNLRDIGIPRNQG